MNADAHPHSSPAKLDDFPVVELFTDGACSGTSGGWAFILRHLQSGATKEDCGGEHATTSNRMEILAVIRGLESLKRKCRVTLFSDSQYVVDAMTTWMARWKPFGWKKTVNAGKHVKNMDLWKRLDELMSQHEVAATWVKGHNGHTENTRCDKLADAVAKRIAKTISPFVELPSDLENTPLFDAC